MEMESPFFVSHVLLELQTVKKWDSRIWPWGEDKN